MSFLEKTQKQKTHYVLHISPHLTTKFSAALLISTLSCLDTRQKKKKRNPLKPLFVMSAPFRPVSEILTSSHKKQSFNDIYGEPENFLEIEVRNFNSCCFQILDFSSFFYYLLLTKPGPQSTNTPWSGTIYGLRDRVPN